MEQLVGFINHFMNLLLPAFWLASLMVLVHRLLFRRQAIAMRWQRQWLWLFASGAAVLLAGLLLQQRDGVAVAGGQIAADHKRATPHAP